MNSNMSSGVSDCVKKQIKDELKFEEGSLPIKYLGVRLMSSRLKKEHCQVLIDKITARISSWTVKHLSYARRLQLINSVLVNMNVYWSSVFVLPKIVTSEVQRSCRGFLWKGAEKVKIDGGVAWDDVCKPRKFGGSGLKKVGFWNKAVVTKQIWSLLTDKATLWPTWVSNNKRKYLNFWGITKPHEASWVLRNLLKIREEVKFFWYQFGDGKKFSFWYDRRMNGLSIVDKFGGDIMKDADIPKKDLVCDVWRNGNWMLLDPIDEQILQAWEYIMQFSIDENRADAIEWTLDENGFSISSTWKELQKENGGNAVRWWSLIWRKQHIPRFSFRFSGL